MSGMEVITMIRTKNSNARIIVNTMHDEIWFMKKMLQLEVDGILFKTSSTNELIQAVRNVLNGKRYYCLLSRHTMRQINSDNDFDLTHRELEILSFIAQGKNTAQIAEELCLSTNTVNTHRRHLMDKLNAQNAADLMVSAMSKGILPIRKDL